MLVSEQAVVMLAQMESRRGDPVKPSTLRAYRSYLNNWIIPILGDREVSDIKNGAMKELVTAVVDKGRKPSTVHGVMMVLKILVSSDIDENGDRRQSRQWNSDFIDAPKIVPQEQETPIIEAGDLSRAIKKATGQYRAFYALLAGTGLRIGEARALRMGPADSKSSIWDPSTGIVSIRTQIDSQTGQEIATKTPAGVREVDVARPLTALLRRDIQRPVGEFVFQNQKGGPICLKSAYEQAAIDGIDKFHSLRRFRATYLDGNDVTETLIKYWMGHGAGSVTEKYIKRGKGLVLRRYWCDKVGLGFEVPGDKDESSDRGAKHQPVE
jgi:integrase